MALPAAAPYLAEFAVQAGVQGVNAITKGGPRRQYKWNKRAAQDTQQINRENAEWAIEQNKRLQEEQRMYDSPQAQMQRYKAAGLNPHLIYGSGSSAGSAFPIQTQGIAPTRVDAPQPMDLNLQAPSYIGAMQAQSGMAVNEQRIKESIQSEALKKITTEIASKNPMLNPAVYTSTIFQFEAVANQKAQQARYLSDFAPHETSTRQELLIDRGTEKMQYDIELAIQKLGLGVEDMKIKNKILESKGYENVLKELEMKWMKDADISPGHIMQGLKLLLLKMM